MYFSKINRVQKLIKIFLKELHIFKYVRKKESVIFKVRIVKL